MKTITELTHLVAELHASTRLWMRRARLLECRCEEYETERAELLAEIERHKRAVKKARFVLPTQAQRRAFDDIYSKAMGK